MTSPLSPWFGGRAAELEDYTIEGVEMLPAVTVGMLRLTNEPDPGFQSIASRVLSKSST